MIIWRKFKISLKYCALILALAALPFSVCCTRTSVNGNSNALQNTSAASNNTNAETANQHLSSPAASSPGINQSASTPDALVREFYTWYLGQLRDGKKPFEDEEKMKQYVTDDFFAEIRKAADDSRVDPALGLPKPESDWYNMKVELGKPKYYKDKALHDAYVDVKYKGFTDSNAHKANGTRFTNIIDEWSIGLQQTSAGWRIASIGIAD